MCPVDISILDVQAWQAAANRLDDEGVNILRQPARAGPYLEARLGRPAAGARPGAARNGAPRPFPTV